MSKAIHFLGGLTSWAFSLVGACWVFIAAGKEDSLLAAISLLFGLGLAIHLSRFYRRPDAVIGAVVFAFLGAIFGPIHGLTAYSSSTETCRANLGQIYGALRLYVAQNDGRMPLADSWRSALQKHQAVKGVLRCPETNAPFTYAMNERVSGLVLDELSDETVCFFECSAFVENASGGEAWFERDRHRGYGWVLLANGRAERTSHNHLKKWVWKLDK